ncbi:MAG: DUF998 domain-containing protein [Erysipelotrichaceae bacterium]|nr:DUF998 domain-containing protein [Erysipelotrichaceae bacterium]
MDNEKLIKRLCNWTMLSGILCVVFYLLHDIIGGMYYPGYDRLTQAVSDLTAVGAPSYYIASGYTSIYGIFSCLCCAFLFILAYDLNKTLKLGIYLFSLMNYVSAIGYSLFPLTGSGYDGSFQSFVHVYVITALVVILSIISLIMISIGSFGIKEKLLGTLSLIALGCMFFGAIGTNVFPKDVFGIIERFSTYSAVIFTGILGVYINKLIVKKQED